MTESLMQQIQEAMNGGKKRAMRVKKAAKAVRKPTGAAGVVRKPAVAKPKRRVVRRTPMKFMGGFFAELNNMVAAEGDAADRKKAMSPAMLQMDAASGAATVMDGGRRIVYKKKAVKKPKVAKAVAKKPRFGSRGRMSFGGYEEMEEQVEEQEQAEQEGGRPKRRVVRRRRSASPARRRAASPARRRATSPARRR